MSNIGPRNNDHPYPTRWHSPVKLFQHALTSTVVQNGWMPPDMQHKTHFSFDTSNGFPLIIHTWDNCVGTWPTQIHNYNPRLPYIPACTLIPFCGLMLYSVWAFYVQYVQQALSCFCHITQTHGDVDKMVDILQTTSPNAFPWNKMFALWFWYHWSLFLRVQFTISHHWFK